VLYSCQKYTFSTVSTATIFGGFLSEHTSASCKACQKSDRKIDVSTLYGLARTIF
jgi:MFS-type transporter involved in bile tolerance (Atg22 family)